MKYGEFSSEKLAQKKLACRSILSEINKFGIDDEQRLFLIHLLALELEDRVAFNDVSTVTKSLCEDRKLLLSIDESSV